MRTTKQIGILTLRGGEMLEIDYEDYKKVVQSYTKSEMGKVYIKSIKRMLDKTIIVDFQEKWVEDRNRVLIEERAAHLLAEKEHLRADPLSPGYIKFIAMSIKLKLKHGTSKTIEVTDEQKPLVNAKLKEMGIEFQL